ncbi:DUF3597 family protein [Erythrobacter gaetbuli]|uniref:DUF3597 family protein n=1 Tax=Qipengyuania gaetbuli TaxID=266952 RepID=A0A844Y089_9SPHN|nr:DUF3597 domain-containing protein [Qipengyuania gaetbuli]MXO51236.1 DUF3597 family protein [Qipengyuania gaetbuli]
MGIFSSIRDAIFGKKKSEQKTMPPVTVPGQAPAKPEPKPIVDVENSLDSMPGADRLNWRTSIVDLMKLIGVDSSYENRKALAQELGRENYSGSADDNVWLHKRTMRELSANGGKVPAEFLD